MAQTSLVSLAVKVGVASLLEVVELVVWSMVAMMFVFLALVWQCFFWQWSRIVCVVRGGAVWR